MIAHLTRALLLLQVLVAIGIAAALMETKRVDSLAPALLLGIGVVLLLRLLITANNFMTSWRFRSETPAAYRIGWLQACRLFLSEFRATMVTSSLSMPFCGFTQRLVPKAAGLPVLLIHGYICNSGYWLSMSKSLTAAGVSHRTVELEPILGDIDDYADRIHQAVEALCSDSGSERLVIVAHSMGGLVARAYLRRFGSEHIAKVITLGTPHHGTAIAQFGLGLNSRQMHWADGKPEGASNGWLHRLAAGETRRTRALFVSIYSHHDNIVAPQTSSHLPGAVNVEFGGIGHVALASDPAIRARVLQEIRKTSSQAEMPEAALGEAATLAQSQPDFRKR